MVEDSNFFKNDLEVQIVHPALEINRNFATVGYRYKTSNNGKVSENSIHFYASDSGVFHTSENTIDLLQYKVLCEDKLLPSDEVYTKDLIRWCETSASPNASQLFQHIKEVIKIYIELPPVAYGLVAAWVMGTYFNRAFPSYPYLSFLGPKETGKSNSLECLKNLCFNAVKTRLTAASLGDTADAFRGTIIIDQAHHLNDELREILVDSYKLGGGKRRVIENNKQRKVLEFDCYCPKAFASIYNLPDDLADRTFTTNMAPSSKSYPNPTASKRDWKYVRTELVKLMLCSYKEVCSLVEELSQEEGQRFGELWLPINVILRLVKIPDEEINEIHNFCERQFSQVRFELSDWDRTLVLQVLNADEEEIEAERLLKRLQQSVGEEPLPTKQYLGRAMRRLGLTLEKKGDKHTKVVYVLHKEHAKKLLG